MKIIKGLGGSTKAVLDLEEALAQGFVRGPFTRWRNRTKNALTLTFGLGPVVPYVVKEGVDPIKEEIRHRQRITIMGEVVVPVAAGSTVDLPSVWDRAIHFIHNDSIIGGQAPYALAREDGTSPPCDRALLPIDHAPIATWAGPVIAD